MGPGGKFIRGFMFGAKFEPGSIFFGSRNDAQETAPTFFPLFYAILAFDGVYVEFFLWFLSLAREFRLGLRFSRTDF